MKTIAIADLLVLDFDAGILTVHGKGKKDRTVRKAKTPKRVTANTFRHSFATHMLQADYDIYGTQNLLGHTRLKTTMIYTAMLQGIILFNSLRYSSRNKLSKSQVRHEAAKTG